jgi:small subunit ribosomal protein S16
MVRYIEVSMLKIRLQRLGAKKRPYYRMVVTESTFPRDGRFLEIVGLYHPIDATDQLKLEKEKILEWMNKGAKPTNTVRALLSSEGIMKEYAKTADSKRTKKGDKKNG